MTRNIYIQNGVLAIISRIKEKINVMKSLHVQSMGVLIVVGVVPLIVFSIIFLNVFQGRLQSCKCGEM